MSTQPDFYRHVFGTCMVAALMSVCVGCATSKPKQQELLVFPPPPAEPRIQFLTWASGADQVEPTRGSFEQFILGDEPVQRRAINKPYGVAARDGVAYVCDTKGLCICKLDFKNKQFSVMGGSGPGRLRKPINIVIDADGNKFVVDPVRKQIVVFGDNDRYITAFDVPEPCHPVDLAIYRDELYVLDNDDTCQIVVLDRVSGKVLRTLGGPGGDPGQFKIPNSLCVDDEGFIYVSDTHNWRIQKLAPDGKVVWAKGTPGYTIGRFGRPRGIRVGPDGIIYVVDGATEIVQMFDKEGNTLMRFGGPGNVPGALGLPSSLCIDATSIPYFKEYIHKDFKAEYLLFVISQYGERLVNVYAFGSFPKGYKLSGSLTRGLPEVEAKEGLGPVTGDQAPDSPAQDEEKDKAKSPD